MGTGAILAPMLKLIAKWLLSASALLFVAYVYDGVEVRSFGAAMIAAFVIALFNTVIRPRIFSSEMGTAWLTHNVEEVGMFEHILPPLHAGR